MQAIKQMKISWDSSNRAFKKDPIPMVVEKMLLITIETAGDYRSIQRHAHPFN